MAAVYFSFAARVTHSNYAAFYLKWRAKKTKKTATKSDNGPKMDYGPYHKCLKRYKTDPFKLGYINYLLVKMWSHRILIFFSRCFRSFVCSFSLLGRSRSRFELHFAIGNFLFETGYRWGHYGSLNESLSTPRLSLDDDGRNASLAKVVFNG